jgi:DNA helicase-2/ATP-dependent DNA helicase PcrA
MVKIDMKYSDFSVLYRVNAQSAAIETALMAHGIPYRVIGGTRFFDRKEIKDILAYLSVINNPQDELRLTRILNEPKRGIGEATLKTAREIGEMLGTSLFEVFSHADEYVPLARRAQALINFSNMIRQFIQQPISLQSLIDDLLVATGYRDMLLAEGVQGQTRLENIEELKTSIIRYEEDTENPSLAGFLEEVALYSDMDKYETMKTL